MAVFLVLGLALCLIPDPIFTIVAPRVDAAAQRPARSRRRPRATQRQQEPKPNPYANFTHATHVTKEKLACNSCHKVPTKNWNEVRKGDDAFADVAEFPEHSACLNCHREQFFARERPAPAICSNCHVAVTPRDTTRFLFPSLGDVKNSTRPRRDFISEFAVNFPHETHLEVVSATTRSVERHAFALFAHASSQGQQAQQPPANCPVCHQTYQPQGNSSEEYVTKAPKNLGDAFWLKKGTFKSIPVSHTLCFTCHNPDSGIAPTSSDCQTCHKLATTQVPRDFDATLATKMGITDRVMLNAWRKRASAGAFRHEGGMHPELACTDCHTPAKMNTADPLTLKVPVRSCGGAEGCHVTATLDEGGALNYEIDQKNKNPDFVCTKCHVVFGKQLVPATHLNAIVKLAQ